MVLVRHVKTTGFFMKMLSIATAGLAALTLAACSDTSDANFGVVNRTESVHATAADEVVCSTREDGVLMKGTYQVLDPKNSGRIAPKGFQEWSSEEKKTWVRYYCDELFKNFEPATPPVETAN